MAILTLIRHGQSVYNLENRFTGNLDVPLTPLGEQEAKLAAIKLAGYQFDIAYTSMLIRAQESLRIILEEMHQNFIPVIRSNALNERMYGDLQGLDKAEISAKFGVTQVEIWRRSFEICPPGGESLSDTYNRTTPYFVTEIAPNLKAGKNVLVVAHGNSLRALMMYLENISHEEIAKINIPTGLPRVYQLDGNLVILNVKYL